MRKNKFDIATVLRATARGIGQLAAAAIGLIPFFVTFTAGSIWTGAKAGWKLSTKGDN